MDSFTECWVPGQCLFSFLFLNTKCFTLLSSSLHGFWEVRYNFYLCSSIGRVFLCFQSFLSWIPCSFKMIFLGAFLSFLVFMLLGIFWAAWILAWCLTLTWRNSVSVVWNIYSVPFTLFLLKLFCSPGYSLFFLGFIFFASQFLRILLLYPLGFPSGSDGEESACNAGDLGSDPGLGRSPGEGKSYPLQCSVWRIP